MQLARERVRFVPKASYEGNWHNYVSVAPKDKPILSLKRRMGLRRIKLVRKKSNTKNQNHPYDLPVLKPNSAGIDIGATEIYVALPPDRDERIRCFQTFTPDLIELAEWLQSHGITHVAMESTGVYWIPLYTLLEELGIDVCLVNARHVKAVPGRKSDVKDCQWLQFLHSVGLLVASFRPTKEICAVRTITRHRSRLVGYASRDIQHMQKAMDQMNLHLHHVLSDITGLSGLLIIDAILEGERDPDVLAGLRHPGVKAHHTQIVKALTGDYQDELIFVLSQAREAYRFKTEQIADCDAKIAELTNALNMDLQNPELTTPTKGCQSAHDKTMRAELHRAFGTDLVALPAIGVDTAIALFTEIGPDLSKFRHDAAFAAWLHVSPDHKKTGGRVKKAKTRDSKPGVAITLRNAMMALEKDKSYYGEMYRRLKARIGTAKALTAMAHRMARLIYHLVTRKEEFDDSHLRREQEKFQERQTERIRRKADRLGFVLVPKPIAQ